MIFNIEPQERDILFLIGKCAKDMGVPAYLVGGYVRDRLLALSSKDMDVVCVGSGIELAERVAAQLQPIPRVVVYKRFGTAMLRRKDMEINSSALVKNLIGTTLASPQ